jgi:extracellular factor (EF) 3-hydroxypalmitic acid methyl ester biosynthesis protein
VSTTSLAADGFQSARPPEYSLSHILQTRRDYVASELERICQRTIRPRILSVSNGRLREAESIFPLCRRKSGEFVALDQNTETLEMLRQEYGPDNIHCVQNCLQNIDPCVQGKFHYIYALNRLNEIQAPAARRLLAKLVGMLHPGGSLLVSNLTPEARDFGYLEETHWRPVYRTEDEMARIASTIPGGDAIGHAIWRDESETIVYLEVQR